jgi:hypothetical protein
MTPDDPRHGTVAGYAQHYRDDRGGYCDPCRAAKAKFDKRNGIAKARGNPTTVPSLGARRRIQALQRLGWSRPQIAAAAGWNTTGSLNYIARSETITRKTHQAIARAYDKLSMSLPSGPGVAQARTWAMRRGYAPPLAWDDIDTDERPHTGTDRWGRTRDADVDPVVVTRILAGDWRLPCTAAEKAAVVAAWDGSHNELARRTGWKVERYTEREDGAA